MDVDERCYYCTYRYKNVPKKFKEYESHPSERCIGCLMESGKHLVYCNTDTMKKVEVAYERR